MELARRLGFGLMDDALGFVGEDDSAVAVGFEVDADVEVVRGSVVEVLDPSGSANNRESEDFFDVFC